MGVELERGIGGIGTWKLGNWDVMGERGVEEGLKMGCFGVYEGVNCHLCGWGFGGREVGGVRRGGVGRGGVRRGEDWGSGIAVARRWAKVWIMGTSCSCSREWKDGGRLEVERGKGGDDVGGRGLVHLLWLGVWILDSLCCVQERGSTIRARGSRRRMRDLHVEIWDLFMKRLVWCSMRWFAVRLTKDFRSAGAGS